jgi:surface antigen
MNYRAFSLVPILCVVLSAAGCAGTGSIAPAPISEVPKSNVPKSELTRSHAGSSPAGEITEHRSDVSTRQVRDLIDDATRRKLNRRDRAIAATAYSAALRGSAGGTIVWRNPKTGRNGTITPGPLYTVNGRRCREIQTTIRVREFTSSWRGTVCQGDKGNWSRIT